MLRKIRISLALVFFVLLTLLFLDFTGTFHALFAWMAKVQLVPAILAVNVVIIIALFALTLFFGRVYCSVICPLGVMQDVVSWFSRKRKSKRKKPFKYSAPITWLRWTMFAVFVVLILAGFTQIAALIEPYSAFGRIAENLFAPIYRLINNLFAHFSEQWGNYAFYPTTVWIKSGIVLGVSVITLLAVGFLAWTKGRLYCNTICPVGTFWGFISRFSLLKPVINESKCNHCGTCALKCKSQCINSKEQKIDYSRCVTCFDCLENCSKKAIKYQYSNPLSFKNLTGLESNDGKIDKSKREFLVVTAVLAATAALKAQESAVDGGLAAIEDKKNPATQQPLAPPGAKNMKHLNQHCTACQLCISACPNNVLRPSTDFSRLMQPEMQYDKGFCRPECVRCGEVCPTRAIEKITIEQKSSLKTGTARWIRENCVVITDEVSCENCERHCPAGAISRVPLDPDKPRGLRIPVVDTERCIGCGACENLCPARPFAAIYVEGNEEQRYI
ncbi:MAG: 4Fe-4S dicluster domain-containing protein [Paludibacter sp.]|nr:4Fe-4S dicluster domain-containing protein [Paludibacter sp.]